jgi:hypothetical protein
MGGLICRPFKPVVCATHAERPHQVLAALLDDVGEFMS